MQNYFNLETEAAFRKSEWERAMAAAAQRQAYQQSGRGRRIRPGRIALAYPRSLVTRMLAPWSRWSTAAERKRTPLPCSEALLP